MDLLFYGLLGVTLFLGNAFLSVAQHVMGSLDDAQLEDDASSGNAQATWLLDALRRHQRFTAGIFTASTFVLVGVGTLFVAMGRLLPTSLVWGLGLGGFIVLVVVTEELPRGWAASRTPSLAPYLVVPLRVLSGLLYPLVWLILRSSRTLARVLQSREGLRSLRTREELIALLEEEEGSELKVHERRMLSRVLSFSHTTVEEVMIPLIEVQAIDERSSVRSSLAIFISGGHSRLPVYSGRIDNVVGQLFAFDVLYLEQLDVRVIEVMRPCKYLPENSLLDRALTELQRSRMGMAVVVNEYGGAVGVVTVEDLLEQVVGDIEDEFDHRLQEILRIGPQEVQVNARLRLEKLREALQIDLPEGDYETVGGLLLARLGRIPRVGDTIFLGSLVFTVRKATDRAIKEVSILVKPS